MTTIVEFMQKAFGPLGGGEPIFDSDYEGGVPKFYGDSEGGVYVFYGHFSRKGPPPPPYEKF